MNRLTKVIFLKELKETFRDKRVILGVVVSPLLLTPLLMAAISFFAGKKEIEKRTAVLDVGIYQQEAFPELTEHIRSDETLNIIEFDSLEKSRQAINDFTARAVIVIPSGAREAFVQDKSAPLEILYNQANENSENARGRLRSILRAFDQQTLASRLDSAALEPSFIHPTEVTETSLAKEEALVGFILSMVLPYLVVMGATFGGINTAFDLCAGEKERGTMETLLVSPASRHDIVQGKLYTIFIVSLISAICSILGILIVIIFGGHVMEAMFGASISFSYLNIAALVLIVIPLSLLTSAGLLFISSFARNQKEAQAYIFPVVAVVIFPAVLSSVLGAESPLYTAFIPVLNIALSMKQLLGNVFDLNFFCISLGSSLLYAIIAMRAVAKLFERESILFRA